MEKITLVVESNKGPLSVSWSDPATLAKYSNIQSGFYLEETRDFSVNLLTKNLQQWNQMFWTMREQAGMFDFSDNSIIVDIGSGVGVVDLLLYSYIPNSKFYLIDNEGWDYNFAMSMPPAICYGSKYPIYNSWSPLWDAVTTSHFAPDRFVTQSPTDKFPTNVDVVMSSHSWCFHYPKETYWNSVVTNLKTGGKLLLDVRMLDDRDIVGEISEEFKCNPVKQDFPKLPEHVDNFASNGWSRCMWTKNT